MLVTFVLAQVAIEDLLAEVASLNKALAERVSLHQNSFANA